MARYSGQIDILERGQVIATIMFAPGRPPGEEGNTTGRAVYRGVQAARVKEMILKQPPLFVPQHGGPVPNSPRDWYWLVMAAYSLVRGANAVGDEMRVVSSPPGPHPKVNYEDTSHLI